ncbi:MAG TPA: exodeoxyribonuclease III [Bacteroidales bacterium]|nr:exodeoxyribonuclease III [Bacteroidales bacterium]
MPRIITYNVNGIRSALGKGLTDWLRAASPDILLLQETKAQPEQIPQLEFEALGYRAYWFSALKKGYSGVGILTRLAPDRVEYGMGIPRYDNEGRFLRADFGDISVVSVYHPSGSSGDDRQAFKMQWLGDFQDYVDRLKQQRPGLIISGDYNICHRPIDIHDPVRNATSSGFLPEEREWMTRFLNSGFVDSFRAFNASPHQYTWWSFRANARAKNLGWRIDYHMVSEPVVGRMTGARILPEAVHSDHCPVVIDIDF